MGRILLLAGLLSLQACSSRSSDVEGAFDAFMRSCEPNSLRADTFDQANGMRTLTVTCRVVRR